MKRISIVLALVLAVAMTLPATAEVEEITVGGSIQVRGQWQDPGTGTAVKGAGVTVATPAGPQTIPALFDFDGDGFTVLFGTFPVVGSAIVVADPDTVAGILASPPTTPAEALALLAGYTVITIPLVSPILPGTTLVLENGEVALPVSSPSSFDEDAVNELDWYTQRTRVNVDAKLSGGVRGFVELQSLDIWGDDTDDTSLEDVSVFSVSPPATPEQLEFNTEGDDLVQLYQAYIEMNDIADYPVQVRVGRQELVYGREWLLGNNDAGVNFAGLSFDAIKVSYNYEDLLTVDAWASKLAELSSPLIVAGVREEDADIDFYGVYASYLGIENMVIDGYWMLRRNANSLLGADTEDLDYLHTVGGRVAGAWDVMGFLPGMLDYNVEAAFQFGSNNVGAAGSSSGDYEGWALNAMAGYTFTDVSWTPRIEAEYAYFSGDDDAFDGDTDEFVRMFSDVHYGELNMGGDLDQNANNLHIVRIGASAVPVEKLTVKGDFYLFWLAEDDVQGLGKTFGVPQLINAAPLTIPGPAVAPDIPVVTVGDDDDVGYELDIIADYQYTEDLNLRLGWAHFFADEAIENSWGNGEDDDIDYVYVQALLVF